VFTKARNWFPTWARRLQSISSPISLKSILILSSHVSPDLPNDASQFWFLISKPCIVARFANVSEDHEDGVSTVIRNVGILPQHYTASQYEGSHLRKNLESRSWMNVQWLIKVKLSSCVQYYGNPKQIIQMSKPVLRPTQPRIQWVPGALPLGVKRPGREANHSPPSTVEFKNVWSCTSTLPICLHGVLS
jgi:hypothetical protein